MRAIERSAPVAAALSALATLACCLPLGIAGAIGALGLSMALNTLRPWLLGLSALLLCVGLVQLYRGRRACQRRSPLSLILFGMSAVVVLGVSLSPQRVADWIAGGHATPVGQPAVVEVDTAGQAFGAEFNLAADHLRVILLLSPT